MLMKLEFAIKIPRFNAGMKYFNENKFKSSVIISYQLVY